MLSLNKKPLVSLEVNMERRGRNIGSRSLRLLLFVQLLGSHYGQTLEIQRYKAVKETAGWEGWTDGLTSAKEATCAMIHVLKTVETQKSKELFYLEGSKPVQKKKVKERSMS